MLEFFKCISNRIDDSGDGVLWEEEGDGDDSNDVSTLADEKIEKENMIK